VCGEGAASGRARSEDQLDLYIVRNIGPGLESSAYVSLASRTTLGALIARMPGCLRAENGLSPRSGDMRAFARVAPEQCPQSPRAGPSTARATDGGCWTMDDLMGVPSSSTSRPSKPVGIGPRGTTAKGNLLPEQLLYIRTFSHADPPRHTAGDADGRSGLLSFACTERSDRSLRAARTVHIQA